jgi:cytochrome c oxidase subunit II
MPISTKIRLCSVFALTVTALAVGVPAPVTTGADSPTLIEIHARKFGYTPSHLTLKKGEMYKLHLTSDDVPHSLRIKALDFKAAMEPDKYNDVLFTPMQAGDFKADCGLYCGAGHKDMSMTVHVVE